VSIDSISGCIWLYYKSHVGWNGRSTFGALDSLALLSVPKHCMTGQTVQLIYCVYQHDLRVNRFAKNPLCKRSIVEDNQVEPKVLEQGCPVQDLYGK